MFFFGVGGVDSCQCQSYNMHAWADGSLYDDDDDDDDDDDRPTVICMHGVDRSKHKQSITINMICLGTHVGVVVGSDLVHPQVHRLALFVLCFVCVCVVILGDRWLSLD